MRPLNATSRACRHGSQRGKIELKFAALYVAKKDNIEGTAAGRRTYVPIWEQANGVRQSQPPTYTRTQAFRVKADF